MPHCGFFFFLMCFHVQIFKILRTKNTVFDFPYLIGPEYVFDTVTFVYLFIFHIVTFK